MKPKYNLKIIYCFLAIFLSFFLCVSQDNINPNSKHNSKTEHSVNEIITSKNDINNCQIEFTHNKYNYKIERIKFCRKVQGEKQLIIHLSNLESAAISPNNQKIAIINYADGNDSIAKVKIFNNYGILLSEYSTKSLTNIAVANNGNLAIYGFDSGRIPNLFGSKLYLYNSSGILKYEYPGSFGPHNIGKFNSMDNSFIFLAFGIDWTSDPREVILLTFDQNFKLLAEHKFKDWPLYCDLQIPKVNQEDKSINIYRKRGFGLELINETIILDFNGNIMERREGWTD